MTNWGWASTGTGSLTNIHAEINPNTAVLGIWDTSCFLSQIEQLKQCFCIKNKRSVPGGPLLAAPNVESQLNKYKGSCESVFFIIQYIYSNWNCKCNISALIDKSSNASLRCLENAVMMVFRHSEWKVWWLSATLFSTEFSWKNCLYTSNLLWLCSAWFLLFQTIIVFSPFKKRCLK